jgi:phage portal protein BeeE
MRLIDQLRGVIVPYPTDSNFTGYDTGFLQSYSSAGNVGGEAIGNDFMSYATLGYAGNGPVFSVLNARLRLFSEATFKYRNLSDKNLWGDQSLSLLEKPWPGGSTSELLGRMIQDADLAGNAFIHSINDTRLERLRPDWVKIISVGMTDPVTETDYREVIGYAYTEGGQGDPVFYPVDDVAHWSPVPDPLAPWRGMSWLTPVLREINADLAMSVHEQMFFEHAATPNMLVRYMGKVDPSWITKLRDQINSTHGGVENSHKTLILDEGADATIIGSKFTDMGFSQLREAGEVRIAAAGGTPPIVAGMQGGLNASTMANYAAAYRNFADSTMHPLWRGACAVLGKFVTVRADAELWFDTRDIPALRDEEYSRQKGNAQLSIAVMNLVNAGYDPATVVSAVVSGDMSLLKHTGLVSVQLLRPNTQLSALAGQAPQTDGGTP